MLLWDPRAPQPIAINDYGNEPRVVRRVTVAGITPVSVDGRPSVARRAAPKPATA